MGSDDQIKADSTNEAGPGTQAAGNPIQAGDALDPIALEIPLLCKDCGKLFNAPYRHFHAGVVFHCPHCRGSFVPKIAMCRAVRDLVEAFRKGGSGDGAELRAQLEKLAKQMRPAGKMVRLKGIAAMFT